MRAMGQAGRWGGSSGCPWGGSMTGGARKAGGEEVGALGDPGPLSWPPAHLQPPRGPAQRRGPEPTRLYTQRLRKGGAPRPGRAECSGWGGRPPAAADGSRDSLPRILTAWPSGTLIPWLRGDTARSLSLSGSASAEAGAGGLARPAACAPCGRALTRCRVHPLQASSRARPSAHSAACPSLRLLRLPFSRLPVHRIVHRD